MTISRHTHAVKPESSVKTESYNRRYSVNLEVSFFDKHKLLFCFISVWSEITFTLKYSIIFYSILFYFCLFYLFWYIWLIYPHPNIMMTGRYNMPLTYETFTTIIDTKLATGLYISLALIVAILWRTGVWFPWKLTIKNTLLRLIVC